LQDLFSGIVDLDRFGAEPLHVQISAQIKTAVLSGKLPPKTRLPSSRMLAADLDISRNTVLTALDQLKAEGVLEAIQGSGMRVAPVIHAELESTGRAPDSPACHRSHRLADRWAEPLAHYHTTVMDAPRPFLPGIPDLSSFPKDQWASCLRRAARHADDRTAGYEAMSGHPRFRQAMARHLADTRGVAAEPEQIIVTSSARGGISLIAHALLSPGEECWVEEPGFRSAKAIFSAAGGTLVAVPVDEEGINPSLAPQASQPRLIYTTPSHQYPTGALMTLPRRLALIERASMSGGYIIEDDYDSEFQYRGRPIAALQGLDVTGSVLYLGTLAKSLIPGLRVGFVVVPPDLAEPLTAIHRHTGQFVAPVIQLALTELMERGHYRAHIRRMKSIYARRLAQFAEEIEKCSEGELKAQEPDGGLQTVIRSMTGLEEGKLIAALGHAGIAGQPLAEFYIDPERARHQGILMGFAAWPEKQALEAFAKLRRMDLPVA